MSFRTQFTTGSSAIGYANSNMQIHGYFFQDDENALNPWEYYDGDGIPVTNDTLNATNIANTEWNNSVRLMTTGAINAASNSNFVLLPYTPWIHCGYQETTVPAGEIPPSVAALYQNFPTIIRRSTIIGKKVKEHNLNYNLSSLWNNMWCPVKPHMLSYYNPATMSKAKGTLLDSSGMVGTWCDPTIENNNTGFAQQWYSVSVCPLGPTETYSPWSRDATMAEDQNSKSDVQALGGPNAPHIRQNMMVDPWLAVEHLPNQDQTIVPVVWDMYVDTEILVEATYDSNMYPMLATIWQIDQSGAGNPQFQFSQPVPVQLQATQNSHAHTRYGDYTTLTSRSQRVITGQNWSFGASQLLGYNKPAGISARP